MYVFENTMVLMWLGVCLNILKNEIVINEWSKIYKVLRCLKNHFVYCEMYNSISSLVLVDKFIEQIISRC